MYMHGQGVHFCVVWYFMKEVTCDGNRNSQCNSRRKILSKEKPHQRVVFKGTGALEAVRISELAGIENIQAML